MTALVVAVDGEEIDGLAAVLAGVRTSVGSARIDLSAALARVNSVSETPDGARLTAVLALVCARTAVDDVEARMFTTEAALRQAGRDYEAAESGVKDGFLWDVLDFGLSASPLRGFALTGTVLTGAAWAQLTGDAPVTAAAVSRIVDAWGVANVEDVLNLAGPLTSTEALGVLGLLALLGITLRRPGSAANLTIEAGPPLEPPAAASPTDVARRVAMVNEEASKETAVVEVQKIEHLDGTVSWVVAAHGAKSLDRAQPMSWPQTSDVYMGLDSVTPEMISDAMDAAGIAPDEAVMMAGHSLGGMAVTTLANDPDFRSRYKVGGVMTFGSPVSHMAFPRDVPTMNVRHDEDIVPSLSGEGGTRDGGPGEHEEVISRSLTGEGTSGDPFASGAHDMPNYVETMELAESEPRAGLEDWDAATKDLFAEPGAVVTATTYRGTVEQP